MAEDVYHKEQRKAKRIVDHDGWSHETPSARDVRELWCLVAFDVAASRSRITDIRDPSMPFLDADAGDGSTPSPRQPCFSSKNGL